MAVKPVLGRQEIGKYMWSAVEKGLSFNAFYFPFKEKYEVYRRATMLADWNAFKGLPATRKEISETPKMYKANPYWAIDSQTNFGAKYQYLVDMRTPGQVKAGLPIRWGSVLSDDLLTAREIEDQAAETQLDRTRYPVEQPFRPRFIEMLRNPLRFGAV